MAPSSPSESPPRGVGVGNLLQAGVYAAGVVWLLPRWEVTAALAGLCAVLQVVGGLALLARRNGRLAGLASLGTLALVALIVGLFGHAAWHVATRFGPDAVRTGAEGFTVVLGALPWAVAFPLWQVLSTRRARRAVPAVLLALVVPPMVGWVDAGPVDQWPEQPDLAAAATAARARWIGGSAALPGGSGPATVLLTPWIDGRAAPSAHGQGADLAAAIEQALGGLAAPPRGARAALVLDVGRQAWDEGLVPAGGGALGLEGGGSPSIAWRPGGVRSFEVLPRWRVSRADPRGGRPARFDSAVADERGAWPMLGGWAAPPPLTAESALAAALAGGHLLARLQDPDGTFTYVVKGPGGAGGGGYNLPRHAGVTWFLARLAARTGDAEVALATDRGLAFMHERTTRLPDGRAYVADPRRDDGRAWVGTTALAVLAASVRGDPGVAEWGAFVASSVGADGQVRGEAARDTGAWFNEDLNPYGHGQAILALAALVRGGDTTALPALQRAGRFFDGGYSPLGGSRLVVQDEHWACLAALATRDAIGVPAGWQVCRAWLADAAHNGPRPGPIGPAAGSAGGGGEAVVAGAFLAPSPAATARARAYGNLFLTSAYRDADAAFLPDPQRLLGGFRDAAWDLDVRMDAVQHVGCALLGIEALLSGEVRPGNLP